MQVLKTVPFLVLFFVLLSTTKSDVFNNTYIFWEDDTNPTFTKIRTVLTTNNLKDKIPENIYPRFRIRSGSSDPILSLKENSISDMPNLTLIILETNNIQDIEVGAFKNLPDLDSLYLIHNKLTMIKNGTFANLPISYLDLRVNKISILEPGAFKNLPNLKVLVLEDNQLEEFPIRLFDEANTLSELNLRRNNFIQIELKDLPNLQILKMDYNKLSFMNCSKFCLPLLTKLDLSYNQITGFSEECFQNLPNLTFVSFKKNRLTELPPKFLSGSKIEELDLSHNKILKIAFDAFDSPSLKILVLSHNELKVWVSRYFENSPNVVKFSADGNQIGRIPEEAFNSGISVVDLSDNRISRVNEGAFKNLKGVKYLDLRGNPISQSGNKIFEKMDGCNSESLLWKC